MLRCTELDPQLGHVGEIVHVDPTLISSLLDSGYIPVIATVGMDDLGQAYNVNADTAAAQIAIALKAEKLVSMTDIAGLLRDKEDESTLIPEVEVSEIEGYKSAGIIAGGMIPKIGGMADAIYQGVHEAVIIDGRVPHSILLELFLRPWLRYPLLSPQPSRIRVAENRKAFYNKRNGLVLSVIADAMPLPGLRHPAFASCLKSTCALLAAAPTTTPCFRHWRRSSLLLPEGEASPSCKGSPFGRAGREAA